MAERYLEQTAQQLRASLAGGLLVEDHHTDFKRGAAAGGGANRELAVDLASFAIDGGRLYIGIDEAGSTPTLHPVELAGLAERIDQVARTRVAPPLLVRCQLIPEPDAPGEGYLVVIVPPSPDAPHQVEGRYRGRSDTTNYTLSDQQVRDLLARRAGTAAGADELLDDEIQRDPTMGTELQEHAHLFVVAHPVHGDDELLHRHLLDGDLQTWLRQEVVGGPAGQGLAVGLARGGWSPDLAPEATCVSRRAAGWAVHSPCLTQNRRLQTDDPDSPKEADLLELEVREDGGVRLFCGRGSDRSDGFRVLFPELVAGLTWRAVRTALTVAETAGYYGSWDLGVALSNMRDVEAYRLYLVRRPGTSYSEDGYRRTARVSYEQLVGDLEESSRDLSIPLGRALSTPITLPDTR